MVEILTANEEVLQEKLNSYRILIANFRTSFLIYSVSPLLSLGNRKAEADAFSEMNYSLFHDLGARTKCPNSFIRT